MHCWYAQAVQDNQFALVLQVFSTYRFTFDHVYAHDSAQADVYMNSARESVLNALQVQFQSALP